jgi:hypothetical protein
MANEINTYNDYMRTVAKIDNIFGERLQKIKKIFLDYGRMARGEFQTIQSAGIKGERKTKGLKSTELDSRMSMAKQYAEQHSNTTATKFGSKLPWRNWTGRATRGLHVDIQADTEYIVMRFKHTMYYGAYLEYGHNRKYAIIEPMMRKYAPLINNEIKKIWGGS